ALSRFSTSPDGGVESMRSGADDSTSVDHAGDELERVGRSRPAERSSAVAVPADRGLRLPFELPHGSPGRAGRRDRLALRSELRFAERVRQPPRPPSRVLPVPPVWDAPPDPRG